jgi:tripartite-type tricarboxylate transporter receptor subunit TctC
VRPIRVLIPFPAAGAADTIGRTIAEPLSAQMRQTIVIDNRPGAAGRIATDLLAKSEPDGYTLLVGGVGPLAISPWLYKKLPYDAERDFLPVTRAAEIINVMVVNSASSARARPASAARDRASSTISPGSTSSGLPACA